MTKWWNLDILLYSKALPAGSSKEKEKEKEKKRKRKKGGGRISVTKIPFLARSANELI